ncbi:hypothetical protein HDU81_003715 [Chytriomyces hyalinus]|nr:hypothetical protein HDU81_003715 [Chytriomyces hyalinus]
MDLDLSLPDGPAPTPVVAAIACFAVVAFLASIALAVKMYRAIDCPEPEPDATDPQSKHISDADNKQQRQSTIRHPLTGREADVDVDDVEYGAARGVKEKE